MKRPATRLPLILVLLLGGIAAGLRGTASAPDAGAALPDDLGAKGSPVVAPPHPQATAELLVVLAPGQNPALLARDRGLRGRYSLRGLPNAHVFAASSPLAALAVLRALAADRRVVTAFLNQRTAYERLAFAPNDPYFHKDTPTPGWPGQWQLINELGSGIDASVQGPWNRDITGLGVTVGIVDDSLETAHPDLAPNYLAAESWDFGQNDANPNPVYADDQHGISVAGVAAARGGNAVGGSGAAPFARLAGLRVDFPLQTTAMFVDATLYHSSGTNTSIKIKNHSYGYAAPYIATPAEVSALQASAAAGTVHCVAAGNDRGFSGQDSNKKQLQNSPDAIAIAALGSNARYANYSCFGACVFATAPSSASGLLGITTTDRASEALGYNGSGDSFPNPDYTSRFGGTSAASPLAAGVLALAKQAQPALNVRFAKHLLALTSDIVDAGDATLTSDGGWKTNAAGYHFNQNYGFGLINADRLTVAATQHSGVTPLATESTGILSVGTAIPDGSAVGVTRNFSLTATAPLEEVLVTLNVSHPHRGDVEAYLTSPSGTTSRLMIQSGSDSLANLGWTFTSNAFWGENPAGTWTLNVRDVAATDTGTWTSCAVTARMGQLVAAPPTAFSFGSASYSVSEGGGSAAITVNRAGDVSAPATVQYATSDGAATAGVDYTTAAGTLSFAAGQTSQTFSVSIADDALLEGNETVQLTLSSPPGSGMGGASTAVLTITDDPALPTPSNLAASIASATAIRVTFKDNCANEADFGLERSADGGVTWSAALPVPARSGSGGSVGFTDSGLPNGLHLYRVRARNGALVSHYSATSNSVHLAPPAAPANLVANPLSTTKIQLTFLDNADNEQGFKLERSTDGGATWPTVITLAAKAGTGGTVTYTNTLLSPGTTYTYRVKAYNNAGSSGDAGPASAATQAAPAAPASLTTAALSTTRTQVSFLDNADNEQGFKLERSTDGGATWPTVITLAAKAGTGGTVTYTDSGLSPGTTYTHRVRAYNDTIYSAYAGPVSVTTQAPPAAPTDLTAVPGTATGRISLTLVDHASNEQGFKLERSTDGGATWPTVITLAAKAGTEGTVTYTNSGLSPGTTYTYRVRAYNDTIYSGYAGPVSSLPGP